MIRTLVVAAAFASLAVSASAGEWKYGAKAPTNTIGTPIAEMDSLDMTLNALSNENLSGASLYFNADSDNHQIVDEACEILSGGVTVRCESNVVANDGTSTLVQTERPFVCPLQGVTNVTYDVCRLYGRGVLADIAFQGKLGNPSGKLRYTAVKPHMAALLAYRVNLTGEPYRLELLKEFIGAGDAVNGTDNLGKMEAFAEVAEELAN